MLDSIFGKGIRDKRMLDEFERVAPETKKTGENLVNIGGKCLFTLGIFYTIICVIFSWIYGNNKQPNNSRPREKYYDRPMNDRVRERRNMNNNRYRR